MTTGLLMIAGGVGAGLFGSLLGLGGGVLIVPLLTFGFGLPIREAAGISLISVIVTSSAAAAVYLQRHTANLRLGMSLELFTAMGALVGGLIAFSLSDRLLAGLFAVLLGYTAFTMARRKDPPRNPASAASIPVAAPPIGATTSAAATAHGADGADLAIAAAAVATAETASADEPADPIAILVADPTALASDPPLWADVPADSDAGVDVAAAAGVPAARRSGPLGGLSSDATLARLSGPDYRVHGLGIGIVGALFAGIVSAILGVGGGIVKVPVMHLAMGVPLRVATATSNLMIGVTATASAIVYLMHGGIDPYVAGPIAVGVFFGATMGSRVAPRVDVRLLRFLFVAVMVYTALQMLLRAVRP